jgi:hypothetical protein
MALTSLIVNAGNPRVRSAYCCAAAAGTAINPASKSLRRIVLFPPSHQAL